MHALVTDRRAPIAALCRHYGVARLDVFGSALRSRRLRRVIEQARRPLYATPA